jgi:Uncharacterised nucleotidyltransferase
MPAGFRFRPPPVELTAELRWLLLRAFGPPTAAPPGPVDGAACHELARRFELAARVAHRTGREALTAEVGADAAARFQRDRLAAAANAMSLEGVARELAAAAARLGMPLVLLKFAALQRTGAAPPGSRAAVDLDVLAPAAGAGELQAALVAAGYRQAAHPGHEHHLPALGHPVCGMVEVHRALPGVRLAAGGRSATLEDLAAQALLVPCRDLPGDCAVPAPAVLAAHALAHGLAQHGSQPAAYALLKMVADLIDLGWAGPEAEGLAAAAGLLVAGDVAGEEVAAARGLAAALAAGELPPAESGAALLLAHALAGRLDPDYAAAQRLDLFAAQPSDRPRAARWAGTLWRTLVLTRGQIDAVYGPPRHPGGYLLRRLARPFDLLARFLRYRASRRRLARRG